MTRAAGPRAAVPVPSPGTSAPRLAPRSAGLRARLSTAVEALWYEATPGPLARLAGLLLRPLSGLTARVAATRRRRIDAQRSPGPPPVIVVGNVLAGGTGKTPIVIAIARALAARGWTPGLLARGHGVAAGEALAVQGRPDPACVGDEPALLARATGYPVGVGRARDAALAALVSAHPEVDVVLSDDGLQHAALRRAVELVVFDARGLGNGHLLPAGPLREPPGAARGADALLLRDGATDPVGHPRCFDVRTAPVGWWRFEAPSALVDDDAIVREAAGRRVFAIAGIARPARFFGRLESIGLCFTPVALADHAPIDPAWLATLPADLILMTEKDAVKCERAADPRVRVLRIEARVDVALIDFLEERLRGCPSA